MCWMKWTEQHEVSWQGLLGTDEGFPVPCNHAGARIVHPFLYTFDPQKRCYLRYVFNGHLYYGAQRLEMCRWQHTGNTLVSDRT